MRSSTSTTTALLLLGSYALLFLSSATPTALAAGSGRVKGLKGTNNEHVSNSARRLKKKKIKGPEGRSCKVSSKPDEVQFECKSRSGGGSKDSSSKDSRKGSSEDNSKGGGKSSSSDPEMASSLDEEVETRGITISPEDIKDKIKYQVKTTNEGIQVQIEYTQEVETDDSETKTETEFGILFENLVEYVKGSSTDDSSESEAYDWDKDEILQVIPLNDWGAIPGVTDDSEGVISYFTATTMPLVAGGGTTSFNFTVSRADQNELITANSMKIDVRIVDFPWTRSDSYVALLSTVSSKKKVKMEYDDEATVGKGKSKKTEDVTISFAEGMDESLGFSTFGEYTWAEEAEAESASRSVMGVNDTVAIGRKGGANNSSNTVIVTGETQKSTIQVVATSPPTLGNETYQGIAYSFVGEAAHLASDIYWDPEAGIGYEASSAYQVSSLGLVLGGILGGLISLVW